MNLSSIARAFAFFALLLLLTAGAHVQAQSSRRGTLTGKLLDAGTNEPIPNAHVVLLRTTDNALISTGTTRADGSFTIAGVPCGQYSFRTTVLGYRAQYPRVTLRPSQPMVAMGNVALQPLGTQLAAVLAAPQGLLAAAR